ncbi:MAG TPA: hypothetical protein VFV78_00760 [Vicinamibacterales bacterium]|nr:hypothetical protein [Vicinamibacterales bacterium]
MRTSHRISLFALGFCALLGWRASAAIAQRAVSTPLILSVAPATPVPAKDPQILRITGQEFQPRLKLVITTPTGGTIELKDDAIQQQRNTSFQVSALISAAGKYSLVVTNPDGGVSAPFVVEARGVTKPPAPVIQRILPENISKRPEPQDLTVEGQNFGPNLKVTVTDPLGIEVMDPVVRDANANSFKLTVKLEMAGPYNLVVSNATGAVSNVAILTVR